MPLLASVVIPTFNRPDIFRCLDALTRQTINPKLFEIIVVSDGPDNSLKRQISELAIINPQIRYFWLPQHQGPAAARNLGWKKAQGKIIAFTDDDTIPNQDWLKVALQEFSKGVKALSGKVIMPIPQSCTAQEKVAALIEQAEFVTANCFCFKSALRKVKGFDERFEMAWREDSDLHFKLIENNILIKKVNNLLVTHPPKEFSWGYCLKEEKKNKFDALLFKNHPVLYLKRIPKYIDLLLLYYAIVATFIIAVFATSQDFFLVSAFLITFLIIKRLWHTSSYSYINLTEIIFTSFLIPFLSIFWRLYGAIKYKVIFF